MSNRDTWQPEVNDIPAALGLLTRIPVQVDSAWAADRGPAQAWAYPLAGVALGIIAVIGAWCLGGLGLSPLAIGIMVVGFTAFITGAMHEDGLADTCDGLWGGWTAAQRLEIMKDSRVGVYGVVGLVTILGIKAVLYGQILETSIWPILGVMAASRAAMVPVMAYLPHARTNGLSHQVGQPSQQTAWLALAIGGLALLITGGWFAIVLVPLVAWGVAVVARSKINGQTGDILGATQQLSEVAALIGVVIWL